MQQYLKYISLCLLLIAGFSSCDIDDDENELRDIIDLGGYAYLTDRSISVFDTDEQLNIDLFTNDQIQVESVEIIQDGQVVTEATISGENATFSASALGDLETGESYPIRIRANLSNGEIAEALATINVRSAVMVDEAPEVIRFQDTTSTLLSFSTFTRYAQVDNLTAFWKINSDGTYMELDEDFDPEGGEIDLGDLDYEEMNLRPGDTLYYRFDAQSGNRTESVETAIPVQSQIFESSDQATLGNSSSINSYDLGEGAYVQDVSEAEISFIDVQGFETLQGIQFVKVNVPDGMTAQEYFNNIDLFEAESQYQNGNLMTSVDMVENGDIFIYAVTRENEDGEDVVYYGKIRIGDTSVINQDQVSFDFEYSEGTILRE